MLLLGVELLKEVEEATAAAAAAAELESRTTQELLPIGHYVVHGGSDRSTLLDHVLSSVPAAQWQAILPPVLKVRPSFPFGLVRGGGAPPLLLSFSPER